MVRKMFLILGAVALILYMGGVFATEENFTESNTTESARVETDWILGEVISVNPANKEIKIKYFDYVSEEEKEKTIQVDENTKYENVNSLAEIKPQDTLSIEYKITPEGKGLATIITKETDEDLTTESESSE